MTLNEINEADIQLLTHGLSTSRTLKNTRKSLIKSLVRKGINPDIADELLKIHGLHPDNFDFVKAIGMNMESCIADISIDTNSNKNDKSAEGIIQEVLHPVKKLLGFDYLYRMMKLNHGKDKAQELVGDMMDLTLGLSDSTNILKPYCWAMDASKLVSIGRPFGQLKSSPCKRVNSYIANVTELIHYMSNHLAGAIAIGTFFLDISHLLLYKEKISKEDLRGDDVRKYLRNCYQQFIHSVNHLSRSNTESPFVNISVFDRAKLEALISDDNFGWMFPKDFGLNGHHSEFVISYIMEVQDQFLSFFNEGDPVMGGMPYRFPVVTINLSKDDKDNIVDNDFLVHITENFDIYRYNIFTSMGSKVASCCRLINDAEMMEMASQSNSFGGSSVSLGSHRVVTINFNRLAIMAKSYDEYKDSIAKYVDNAARILKSHKNLLLELEKKGMQPLLTNKWIDMRRMFSTFGIMGIVEADQTIKTKFDIKEDVIYQSLDLLNKFVAESSKEYGIVGNIEQIPGESFAVRLAEADSLIYGKEEVPYRMYSNQFVPLWDNVNVMIRMAVDGRYNKLITGGGIVHATIGEPVLPSQARKIIKHSVSCGCEHFALNAIYSQCANGHASFGNLQTCSKCSADIVERYTRVVGFFTPVGSWNKTRRNWEFPIRKVTNLDDI